MDWMDAAARVIGWTAIGCLVLIVGFWVVIVVGGIVQEIRNPTREEDERFR